jgi:hypothetical protein
VAVRTGDREARVRLFRALLLVVAATVVVQSLPDVARYLRMRNL